MGFFQTFFGSSGTKEPVNFGLLSCDLHSHLIPGIDDGSQSLDESLGLIKKFKKLGFKKLITTPHIQDEFYKNTPEIINSGLAKLKKALELSEVDIEIEAAAEYLLDDGFEEKMRRKELMTFGKNYILVEFSYFNPHPNLKSFIFDLQLEGLQVILAHPERYGYWFNNFRQFEELKDRGVLFQLNLVSLGGQYGKEVKKMAKRMIDLGMIDLVGSDMHNQYYMDSLVKASYDVSLHKLVNSGKLLNNQL